MVLYLLSPMGDAMSLPRPDTQQYLMWFHDSTKFESIAPFAALSNQPVTVTPFRSAAMPLKVLIVGGGEWKNLTQ